MFCMQKWFTKKIHLVLLKTKRNYLAGFIANINWAVNIRKYIEKNVDKTLSNCPSSGRSEEELGMGLAWCCCLGKMFLFSSVSHVVKTCVGNASGMMESSGLMSCTGLCLSRNTGIFSTWNKEIKSIFLSIYLHWS